MNKKSTEMLPAVSSAMLTGIPHAPVAQADSDVTHEVRCAIEVLDRVAEGHEDTLLRFESAEQREYLLLVTIAPNEPREVAGYVRKL